MQTVNIKLNMYLTFTLLGVNSMTLTAKKINNKNLAYLASDKFVFLVGGTGRYAS